MRPNQFYLNLPTLSTRKNQVPRGGLENDVKAIALQVFKPRHQAGFQGADFQSWEATFRAW